MADRDPTAQAGSIEDPSAGAGSLRVVLVDADDADRYRTTQQLLAAGLDVVAAVASYAQAIVATRRHRPDVIVTDLHAGQLLTPRQYVIALRRFCTAPVMVYSSHKPTRAQLADWGVHAAVPKAAPEGSPNGSVRLVATVRRAYDRAVAAAP
jgi:AmiR/NasT family two-component response regulator